MAGVIGAQKFIYDVWEDTVNTASCMESHGVPGENQTTETTFELLKDNYHSEEWGEIEVKDLP